MLSNIEWNLKEFICSVDRRIPFLIHIILYRNISLDHNDFRARLRSTTELYKFLFFVSKRGSNIWRTAGCSALHPPHWKNLDRATQRHIQLIISADRAPAQNVHFFAQTTRLIDMDTKCQVHYSSLQSTAFRSASAAVLVDTD